MTSNFFAPAAYYNEATTKLKRKKYLGKDGSQITGFKDMVKAFHKEGIAVVMDVVTIIFQNMKLETLNK